MLTVLQLTAKIIAAVSSYDDTKQERVDLRRHLGVTQWKPRIKGGAASVISNPTQIQKDDSPTVPNTTTTFTTAVKRSYANITTTTTTTTSSTTGIMTSNRSQNPNKWYKRPGTNEEIPSYTQESMKSPKTTRKRVRPKMYNDALRKRTRPYPKRTSPKHSSIKKSKVKIPKMNTKRTRPMSKYLPSKKDSPTKSKKSSKSNTKRKRSYPKYYPRKSDSTKKSKMKSAKKYSKKKYKVYPPKKIINPPNLPRPPQRPTRPTVRPPFPSREPTSAPSPAPPSPVPTLGPRRILVQLPVGDPGDPAVLFNLLPEGSGAILEIGFSNNSYDTVYLVENTNVGSDCPTTEGILVADSPVMSVNISLNEVDSVVAVCSGEDVVAKAHYVFEDFNNGVGGSNVGDEVST